MPIGGRVYSILNQWEGSLHAYQGSGAPYPKPIGVNFIMPIKGHMNLILNSFKLWELWLSCLPTYICIPLGGEPFPTQIAYWD